MDEDVPVGRIVVVLHYADIAAKLNQPILAAALSNGFVVPDEIRFPAGVWQMRVGPYSGRRYVGGYFSRGAQRPEFIETDEGTIPITTDLQLDRPEVTFFGLDESIFIALAASVRSRDAPIADIAPLPNPPFVYSGISALRDGSIIGPLSFCRLAESRAY